MPSLPVPDPVAADARHVLFDPLEGRRQGPVPPAHMDAYSTSAFRGCDFYQLSCRFNALLPARHSYAAKPSKALSVKRLSSHLRDIEAIKGSAAVCLRCLQAMRRHSLQPEVEEARKIYSVGAAQELATRDSHTGWRSILGERRPDSPAGPRLKPEDASYWACPYCAVDGGGSWQGHAPAIFNPHHYLHEASQHTLVYALPYLTTHLLLMTQALVPPKVSHLRITAAYSSLRAESRSRFNVSAPYRSSDKPTP